MRRWRGRVIRPLAGGLLVLVLGLSHAVAARPARSFALVVGNNHSLDRSLKALRFADDDAVRFFELVSSFATRSVLLTAMDGDTQRSHHRLAALARAPTRPQLRRAMDGLRQAMRRARSSGARTVFYFYFAGHGDVGQDGEGFIHLVDGRFARTDLYREVIARSVADVNHVIVDACNSYFLVKRGGGPKGKATQRDAIRSFLARESLDKYANTGVVLSTATMKETHEWSRYRSGIFSHQLISALWGAADVNGDGQVDYREAAAFVAAANNNVRDAKARLTVYVRPPSVNRRAPLIDLKAMRRASSAGGKPGERIVAFLTIPLKMEGHYYIEDDRGVRYLDFNKTREQTLRLALLDRPYFYVRSRSREALVRPRSEAEIDAGTLTFTEREVQQRGSVEQSFRRDLFSFPFGRGFAAGHAAAAVDAKAAVVVARDRPAEPSAPWFSRAGTWKWVALGAAAASLAAGITMQVLASRSAAELDGGGEISMARAVELQEQMNDRQAAAAVGFALAGAGAVTSLVLFLADRPPAGGPAVNVALLPTGGAVGISGSF